MADRVDWGVIGAGGFADRRSMPGLRQARNCTLKAVMVRDKHRAADIAAKHNAASSYDDVDELLSDEQLQAVYIATPVDTHRPLTLKAAAAGKHILCEKPMALSVRECEEMIQACRDAGVKLGIGFMRRFHPCHQEIKNTIEKGRLGRIGLARIQTHYWYPPTAGAWRQEKARGGGGPLMDVGAHCIDLLRFFLGDISSVSALCENLVQGYDVEDIATILLKFSSGPHGIVDCSFAVTHRQNLIEIYGTEDTLIARRTAGGFPDPELFFLESGELTKMPVDDKTQYAAQFEGFARAILHDEEPPVTGLDGLINMKIMVAAYESSRTGKRMEL